MKFAVVNGQRQEAQPGLLGQCLACGQPMVAKCGTVRVRHWAHRGHRTCDPWWETETEWHRAWKGQFPVTWQEVVHHAENGEKHIADVKTDQGWVLEFQHSYIKPAERQSRNAFYPKIAWVVDGTRRMRDRTQLLNAWKDGSSVGANSPIRRMFSDECALLREWAGGHVPVFFDFGEAQVLWWLLDKGHSGSVYIAQFSRSAFIEIHRGTAAQEARDFDEEKGVSMSHPRFHGHPVRHTMPEEVLHAQAKTSDLFPRVQA